MKFDFDPELMARPRLLLCHRMYVSWAWEAEVRAWNAKQIAASKIKKINNGETDFSKKL